MALEYLPGGTLEMRLADGRRLAARWAAIAAVSSSCGLGHAHAHGLVHRDVNPANVFFDGEGRPKDARAKDPRKRPSDGDALVARLDAPLTGADTGGAAATAASTTRAPRRIGAGTILRGQRRARRITSASRPVSL